MNRNDEYKALLEELDETPLKLDYALERAQMKCEAKKRRKRKAAFAPVWIAATVFGVFVLLVNISPTFAYAAGRIPYLRDLAKFVALSPSLSAAVENEYVQPINQEQTQNGITARIEYAIIDQKQLNIFYTLVSDTYSRMNADPHISGAGEEKLEGYSTIFGELNAKNGDLRQITIDFSYDTVPDTVMLKLKVSDNGASADDASAQAGLGLEEGLLSEEKHKEPEIISVFDFTLSLDPNFTAKGETIELNKGFKLDGQKFTLKSAEIYPTHMRFNFDDDKNNTAWLKNLEFYVETEKGERFEGISNGISASGSTDSPMMATHMLESAFFSDSEHLTLHITGVTWLDKDMEKVHVDLAGKTAEVLPEGVAFELAKQKENGWILGFSAPSYREKYHDQMWNWNYFDRNGNEHSIGSSCSTMGGYYDEDTLQLLGSEDTPFTILALKNYPDNEVWLCPAYSRRTALDTPVSIQIK